MKHFIAISLLISSFFPVLADQHEKIINEISEINDVEAVYITKSMLNSIGNNNIKIGNLNISKIINGLSSIYVLSIDGNSLQRARKKLQTIKNSKGMEVIMRLKEDNERTDILGKKLNNGNFSSILMTIDEGDEITVVYIIGNIDKNCLAELSKEMGVEIPNKSKKTKYNIYTINSNELQNLNTITNINDSSVFYLNYTTEYDKLIASIEDSIKVLNKIVDKINTEKLNAINSIISALDKQINSSNNSTKRNKLFKERSELFKQRNNVYEERNKIYHKRNLLYNKRNNLLTKKYTIYTKSLPHYN
ncbi:MAG: DUF4252 domain-containing protein [Bacteroidales bacterium]|nr:DUF4252 domain-containing protein [Bacteroidales bacterium]